jgi:acetyl esterase
VLRDHGDTRLRHQALIYPATDLTMSSASMPSTERTPS